MSAGIRERVLRAVVALGRVDNPHELQELAGADTHSVVHCLYALRAAGLATSRG